VTAGNSSGINDGAATVLIASEEAMDANDWKPMARVVASATAGVEPRVMGLGPIHATRALGHPLGCSGARIMTTLVHEMQRRDARYGLAAMCIGVGQGIAAIVERT